ncbi:type II secretion system protein [Allohahella marinimesophila]|uniref:MSHA pilin protein MshD n=1 Tax=Allohahella marinimesophila TaxID=1054972 RepID=A0ABP7NX22_9GAMM
MISSRLGRSLQQGVTLVELVITIIVMGIALTAIIGAMSATIGRSSNIIIQDRSLQLAQAYLDEIAPKRFDENTPSGGVPSTTYPCDTSAEGGESRETYDDLGDYDGLVDNPPRSQTSSQFVAYEGYSVSVKVECTSRAGIAAANLKLITVTVTPPSGPSMAFARYRSNF